MLSDLMLNIQYSEKKKYFTKSSFFYFSKIFFQIKSEIVKTSPLQLINFDLITFFRIFFSPRGAAGVKEGRPGFRLVTKVMSDDLPNYVWILNNIIIPRLFWIFCFHIIYNKKKLTLVIFWNSSLFLFIYLVIFYFIFMVIFFSFLYQERSNFTSRQISRFRPWEHRNHI